MGIVRFGKLVFAKGSIFERYLVLLKKAKKLAPKLDIQKLMKSFADSPSTVKKKKKIKEIKSFINFIKKRRKK